MKKIIPFFCLGALLFFFSGCTTVQSEFAPPPGVLFSYYTVPLILSCDQGSVSERVGKASCHFVEEPFTGADLSGSWGDCSVATATENGRFSRVGTADYRVLNVLGVYKQTSVRVYHPSKSSE